MRSKELMSHLPSKARAVTTSVCSMTGVTASEFNLTKLKLLSHCPHITTHEPSGLNEYLFWSNWNDISGELNKSMRLTFLGLGAPGKVAGGVSNCNGPFFCFTECSVLVKTPSWNKIHSRPWYERKKTIGGCGTNG